MEQLFRVFGAVTHRLSPTEQDQHDRASVSNDAEAPGSMYWQNPEASSRTVDSLYLHWSSYELHYRTSIHSEKLMADY